LISGWTRVRIRLFIARKGVGVMEGEHTSESASAVTIKVRCPTDGTEYLYDLAVRYSEIAYATEPKPRIFTRFFNCPVHGMFEQDIKVSGSVADVRVLGPHPPSGDGS
jgi:hypothetical protein